MCRTIIPALIVSCFALAACLPNTHLVPSCPLPDGVGCLSTPEVFERLKRGSLPAQNNAADQRDLSRTRAVDAAAPRTDDAALVQGATPVPGAALYEAPAALRIWINRFTDEEGDLHDASFVYVLLGRGHWTVLER